MTSRRGEGAKSETASERVTCSQTQAQNCCQVCGVCVLRVCVLYIHVCVYSLHRFNKQATCGLAKTLFRERF